jgi:hypothetical protein
MVDVSVGNGHPEVEAKTTPNLLIEPGARLLDAIADRSRAGCPAWRVQSLRVPRTPFSAGDRPGYVVPAQTVGIPIMPGIRDAVTAALVEGLLWPYELKPHESAQLRRFYAAAVADLADIRREERDTRVQTSRDRDIRDGRRLWATVGAWPWSLFGPDGHLESPDWTTHDHVVRAWRQWIDSADN